MTQVVSQDVAYDFDALLQKFQEVVGELMTANQTNAIKITSITDQYLGKGKKVMDCTPEQSEQIDLIIHDLEEMLKKQ